MISKYLIQISIRKLHNEVIISNDERRKIVVWKGNTLLVSDMGFRFFNSNSCKEIYTRYKQIC